MLLGPFGEPLTTPAGLAAEMPFRFSTKYKDTETGLYYYIHRYYETGSGRWLSRDPIEEEGGMNLYGFVKNSPILRFDYLGLLMEEYTTDTGTLELKIEDVGSGKGREEAGLCKAAWLRDWRWEGTRLRLDGKLTIALFFFPINREKPSDPRYRGMTIEAHERRHAELNKVWYNAFIKEINPWVLATLEWV